MSAVIRVTLVRKALQIEPGQQGELAVTIQNLSEIVDQYVVMVEGLDVSWLTLSPPRISLFPQDEGQVTIKLHPPQNARAGTYDFAVRVESRENPVEWTRVQATLDVSSVFVYDVSLSPQRKSIVEEEATYDVLLTNPGNVDVTLNLSASDPEEGCTYRFHPSQKTVEAGGSARVPLVVSPKRAAREQGKLHDFTVKAAPVDAPQRARTVSGQLECEPQVVSLDLSLWPQRRSAVGAGTFQVQLNNRGNTDLSLALEGTDPEEACAYKFEPQRVTLRAGESRQIPLTVAPIGRPVTDQTHLYDFTVRALPENAPHEAVQASGQLECLPVVIAFDIEILPGERTVQREAEYDVRLVNRGETSLSLELAATDENGACDYRFDASRVSLGPEETKRVPLRVTARERPSPGQTRRHTFNVEATPADAPHLAKRATARIEVVRRRGLGVLAWSTIGFAVGGLLVSALAATRLHPARFVPLSPVLWDNAVVGAAGGLALGIAARRRVWLVCLAGTVGFVVGVAPAALGYVRGAAGSVIWGAVAGGMLGLALQYRWRAVFVAAASAVGWPLWFKVWGTVGLSRWGLWRTIDAPLLTDYHQVVIASALNSAISNSVRGLIFGLAVVFLERERERRRSRRVGQGS